MDGKEIGAILLKRIDVKGLVCEDVMAIVKVKLEEIVKDSSNSFDDAAFAMLWPLLEKGVSEGLDKLLEPKV
jgi:hypothetical protein